MKALLIAALASAIAVPAFAQDSGHKMPMPAVEKPADPHAGHDMSKMGAMPAAEKPADPHAGHDMSKMGAMPAAEKPADPHAGHDMSKMGTMPAAEKPADPHAGHGMAVEADTVSGPPDGPPPPSAFSGPDHAADTVFDPLAMEQARGNLRGEHGDTKYYGVVLDRLEARVREGQDGYLWDGQGWYGGDIDKAVLKTEGEGSFGERLDNAEIQALWSHAITPWFDLQTGARYDVLPGSDRGYFALGLQGLVPYQFEVDAAAFVSNEGDVSGRVEAEYDLLLTQRFILQPRAEINLAIQEVREFGVGSGVTDAELGLRLRYEFAREFAPYIGVDWERKLGKTADFAREDGESANDLFFVIGMRVLF